MIASTISIDDERLWTQEGDCIRPDGLGADLAFVLPETLRLVAHKLWALRKLIAGIAEPREYEDLISLNTCEVLAADAGHDLELILDEFERWVEEPEALRHCLTDAMDKRRKAGEGDPDEAAKERVIENIVLRLREQSHAFLTGMMMELMGGDDESKEDDSAEVPVQPSRKTNTLTTAIVAGAGDNGNGH